MTSKEAKLLATELKKLKPSLVICGGGHIALSLAQMAETLDFDVTVLEDREDYANSERFPKAKIILGEPVESVESLEEDKKSYFVIAS
ncbi:MAG: XdhC/CoxF family protein [Synergistaceae bacterium]|nr:XdhC/CoxF family protein [Synergistaceae bacterium]